MKTIAIIYHSRQGHTQFIAEQIQIGAAQIKGIEIDLFTAESLMSKPELLIQYDGLIWGVRHI
jgi:flavodoxin